MRVVCKPSGHDLTNVENPMLNYDKYRPYSRLVWRSALAWDMASIFIIIRIARRSQVGPSGLAALSGLGRVRYHQGLVLAATPCGAYVFCDVVGLFVVAVLGASAPAPLRGGGTPRPPVPPAGGGSAAAFFFGGLAVAPRAPSSCFS